MMSEPVSDVERMTTEHVERMASVKIDVEGVRVAIVCDDEFTARDLATAVALLLADRIAWWRQVVDQVPSRAEHVNRLTMALRKARAEPGGSVVS
jgi:hypothetical protein